MKLSFDYLFIMRCIYLLLVALTALASFHYSTNNQHAWVILAALIFSQVAVDLSLKRRMQTNLIIGFLSAVISFLVGWLSSFSIPLIIFLFVVTFICTYIGHINQRYFFIAVVINLFALLSAVLPISSLNENLSRTVFILLGLAIPLIYQLIFWPGFFRKEWNALWVVCLRQLALLNRAIFACFIEANYSETIYLYERRLHLKKTRFLGSLVRLEKEKGKTAWIAKIERVFDVMMDAAQLRRRVTDYTIFEVCRDELSAISNVIQAIFSELIAGFQTAKPHPLSIELLAQSIKRLEENYQHVMQVTAREPLPFLLFIASLKNLQEELASIDQLFKVV